MPQTSLAYCEDQRAHRMAMESVHFGEGLEASDTFQVEGGEMSAA